MPSDFSPVGYFLPGQAVSPLVAAAWSDPVGNGGRFRGTPAVPISEVLDESGSSESGVGDPESEHSGGWAVRSNPWFVGRRPIALVFRAGWVPRSASATLLRSTSSMYDVCYFDWDARLGRTAVGA